MRNRKKSFEDRVSAADQQAASALDVFEKTANDLDAAAAEADAVVLEAEAEVERVRQVRDIAYQRAAAHASRAAKIRELVNG